MSDIGLSMLLLKLTIWKHMYLLFIFIFTLTGSVNDLDVARITLAL